MKPKLLLLALGALFGLGFTAAQAATPSPEFLGTWELVSSSGDSEQGPKIIALTIKDAGGGKWSSQAVLEMPDGSQRPQPAILYSLDGAPNPLAGDLTLVVLYPDPRTAAATILQYNLPVAAETSTLSADGQELVHMIDTTGPDGGPVHLSQTFRKKK